MLFVFFVAILMQLTIPELSLVLLVGPAGCGKSTFARKHFRPTEIISSDFFRAMVSDDESDQSSSRHAFEVLHLVTAKRLAGRRFTVIDATNLKPDARRPLLALAHRYHFVTIAIVFNLPEQECQERNRLRAERHVEEWVITSHAQVLQQAIHELEHERFQDIVILRSPADVDALSICRLPPPFDRRQDHGPFDIIGDVHGCLEELTSLLAQLGYRLETGAGPGGEKRYKVEGPPGRTLVFVGDLIDRGPYSIEVLRLTMDLTAAGQTLVVIGNHDDKLLRYLHGREVTIGHGLAETLAQLKLESEAFAGKVRDFLHGLPTHYLLDGGKLVVAHAGLREDLQGRDSKRVRAFALYGEATGAVDEYGLPVRGNWGKMYTGPATVIHGHTPVAVPQWINRTLNIDTGCVFGGRLTALRYPENELVSVPARQMYCVPARPFLPGDTVKPVKKE